MADRATHAGPAVIGRHSRDHVSKWPTSADDILAAYPDDERYAVRVLGGASPVAGVLGRIPRRWTVVPFGGVHPARFLRGLDYFVYFHHPGWVEAFGRNVIEAMASGAPAILPPSFKALFGDAALYGDPSSVTGTIERLQADPPAYDERVVRGRAFVEEHFGAGVHVRRLRELIGEPRRPAAAAVPRPRRPRRVLLVSMPDTGIGSVARLLRLAERLHPAIEPVFSVGVPATAPVSDNGYFCDHLDLRAGGPGRVARRLRELIEREEPDLVVLEGRELAPGCARVAARGTVPFAWITPDAAPAPSEDHQALVRIIALAETGAFLPPRKPAAAAGPRPRALVALGGDARGRHPELAASVVAEVEAAGFDAVLAAPVLGTGGGTHRLDLLGTGLEVFDAAVIGRSSTLAQDLAAAGVAAVPAGDGGAALRAALAPLVDPDGRRALLARAGQAADGTPAVAELVSALCLEGARAPVAGAAA